MPEIAIILVEPLHEGNVGFTARVMKNFGFTDLVLVNPCSLGEEARARSMHAFDVLDKARVLSLDEVFGESHLTIATTGELSRSVCKSMRMPYYSPRELREQVRDLEGRVSILFGREDRGLSNGEVERCDMVCTIPSSPDYPILNLSHAVGILCYELANLPRGTYRLAEREEMEGLYRHLDHFLDKVDHAAYKRKNTLLMARRILGRTLLTTREVTTIHGILRRTEWHLTGGPWETPGKKKGEKEKQEK
jgi:tRNA/rRNA methyltransferase